MLSKRGFRMDITSTAIAGAGDGGLEVGLQEQRDAQHAEHRGTASGLS